VLANEVGDVVRAFGSGSPQFGLDAGCVATVKRFEQEELKV
jgi:hypothetical protein